MLFKEYRIFVKMTTLTVNIADKKTEKAIKAVLDALELDYSIAHHPAATEKPLNKSEKKIYSRLERTAEEIKLFKDGRIELQDANEFLNEL